MIPKISLYKSQNISLLTFFSLLLILLKKFSRNFNGFFFSFSWYFLCCTCIKYFWIRFWFRCWFRYFLGACSGVGSGVVLGVDSSAFSGVGSGVFSGVGSEAGSRVGSSAFSGAYYGLPFFIGIILLPKLSTVFSFALKNNPKMFKKYIFQLILHLYLKTLIYWVTYFVPHRHF